MKEKQVGARASQSQLMKYAEDLGETYNELKLNYEKLHKNFLGFIRIFVDLMELYDPKVSGHSKRVALLCVRLAKKMKLGSSETEAVEVAAYLHNIGLIGIPRELINRLFDDEELTTKEKAIFKKSGPLGQMLLKHIGSLDKAGVIIRAHKERFDGHGAPDSIKGSKIPMEARMLAICKHYDSHNAARADKLSREDALKSIAARKGTTFDPKIADVFIEMITEWPEDKAYKVVTAGELIKGMIVSKDLFSESGRMLVAAGTTLSTALIEILNYHEDIDPIVGDIYILKEQ